MAIKKREYRDEHGKVYKTRYRVRWVVRDLSGKRRFRSKEFRTITDARSYEADVRQRVTAASDARRTNGSAKIVTLQDTWDDFREEKERNHTLERSTIASYESVWDKHLKKAVGHLTLAECDGTARARDRALGYFKQNDVGVATQRRALTILSSVLTYATDYGLIRDHNTTPRRGTLGTRTPKHKPRMISVRDVETMRAAIRARRAGSNLGYTAQEMNVRDALFVTLIAYGGLRPAEVMGLKWKDIILEGTDTLIQVRRQVADGTEKKVKNYRAADQAALRDLGNLPTPLVRDLADWKAITKFAKDGDFLFHQAEGTPWSKTSYKRWSALAFRVGLAAVAADGTDSAVGARPYDLRHSLCMTMALVLTPYEAARRAGHTTQVAFGWYVTASQNPAALNLGKCSSWEDWRRLVAEARIAARDQQQAG